MLRAQFDSVPLSLMADGINAVIYGLYIFYIFSSTIRSDGAGSPGRKLRTAGGHKNIHKGWLALIVTVAGAAMTTAVARKSNRYTNSTK